MAARIKELENEIKRKDRELAYEKGKGEILKRPAHLYATPRMKYEVIYANRALYSVRKIYEALKISQCQYYQWIRIQSSRENRKNREIWLVETINESLSRTLRSITVEKFKNSLK